MLTEQDSFRGVISELDHAVTALQSSTDLAAVASVHEQVSATACQSQGWMPSLLQTTCSDPGPCKSAYCGHSAVLTQTAARFRFRQLC